MEGRLRGGSKSVGPQCDFERLGDGREREANLRALVDDTAIGRSRDGDILRNGAPDQIGRNIDAAGDSMQDVSELFRTLLHPVPLCVQSP
jgi:hypothetical protein